MDKGIEWISEVKTRDSFLETLLGKGRKLGFYATVKGNYWSILSRKVTCSDLYLKEDKFTFGRRMNGIGACIEAGIK